jgi:hypothetical protein
MSTTLGNGSVTFGDSTTLTSANIPWTNLANRPTQLSQFTNNLGNYGGWLTASSAIVNTTANCGYWAYLNTYYLAWTGSQIQIIATNCNCQCNC